MNKIRIALIDDHKILCDVFEIKFKSHDKIELVGAFYSAEEFLKVCDTLEYDILIADLSLPGDLQGIDLISTIYQKDKAAKVLVLSAATDEETIIGTIKSGVSGYVLKDEGMDVVEEAIIQIYGGGQYFCKRVNQVIYDAIRKEDTLTKGHYNALTVREKEVLKLLALGLTPRKIGTKLGISHRTVEVHRSNIMEKLDIFTVAELVKYAIKNAIISL
ncbi:MAG: response regulator transcription factor [Bacteroidales bacterium]|nr:response regulator transcription factor [Bacteroidales bacterium]